MITLLLLSSFVEARTKHHPVTEKQKSAQSAEKRAWLKARFAVKQAIAAAQTHEAQKGLLPEHTEAIERAVEAYKAPYQEYFKKSESNSTVVKNGQKELARLKALEKAPGFEHKVLEQRHAKKMKRHK